MLAQNKNTTITKSSVSSCHWHIKTKIKIMERLNVLDSNSNGGGVEGARANVPRSRAPAHRSPAPVILPN